MDPGASLLYEWEYPRNENEKQLLCESPSVPFLPSQITFSLIPSVPGTVNTLQVSDHVLKCSLSMHLSSSLWLTLLHHSGLILLVPPLGSLC